MAVWNITASERLEGRGEEDVKEKDKNKTIAREKEEEMKRKDSGETRKSQGKWNCWTSPAPVG